MRGSAEDLPHGPATGPATAEGSESAGSATSQRRTAPHSTTEETSMTASTARHGRNTSTTGLRLRRAALGQ